jgi:TrkA domain protein
MTSRGLPGVTVVAVVRGETANPAPAEDFKVFPGDTLVVAGAPEKVAKAFQFYRTGEFKAKAPADSVSAPPGS